MEQSPEMSLAQRLAAQREKRESEALRKDSEVRERRAQERDARRAERERLRLEREKSIRDAIDTAKNKVKSFREWDHINMVKIGSRIAGVPEDVVEVVKTGVDVVKGAVETGIDKGKKFAQERRDEVVDAAKAVGHWVEDRCIDVVDFTEATCDKIVDGVEEGIDKVKMKYEKTRDGIIDGFMEAKKFTSDELTKGKNKLVEAWRRTQASFGEDRQVRAYEKWQKLQEKADRARERYTQADEKVGRLHGDLAKVRAELAS